MNRTQALVLGFFAAAWLALVALLIAAPQVYAASVGAADRAAQALFLAALTAFLALLAVGVARRWRWAFWLIAVAFVAGVLRVPAAALELAGVLPPRGPAWYTLLQGAIGLVQLAIGLLMLAGYRRGGVWAAF
jgi:hypothetical protein